MKWFTKRKEESSTIPLTIPSWSTPVTSIEFSTLDDRSLQILTSVLGILSLRGEAKETSLTIVNVCLGLSQEMNARKLLTIGMESCEYEPPVEKYTVSKSLRIVKKEIKK